MIAGYNTTATPALRNQHDMDAYSKEIQINDKTFVLRQATPSDIDTLAQIINDVFIELGWIFEIADELPDYVQYTDHYSNPEKNGLYALECDGYIIGSIALKHDGKEPYLSRVYLKKEFRGYGLGKWMTVLMMNLAKERGQKQIHLWTDTRFEVAHNLYHKVGFVMNRELRSLHDVNNSFEWKMSAIL